MHATRLEFRDYDELEPLLLDKYLQKLQERLRKEQAPSSFIPRNDIIRVISSKLFLTLVSTSLGQK